MTKDRALEMWMLMRGIVFDGVCGWSFVALGFSVVWRRMWVKAEHCVNCCWHKGRGLFVETSYLLIGSLY